MSGVSGVAKARWRGRLKPDTEETVLSQHLGLLLDPLNLCRLPPSFACLLRYLRFDTWKIALLAVGQCVLKRG